MHVRNDLVILSVIRNGTLTLTGYFRDNSTFGTKELLKRRPLSWWHTLPAWTVAVTNKALKFFPTGVELRWLLYPLASLLLFFPFLRQVYWPAADGLDVAGEQIGRDFINVWAAPQLAFGGHLGTLFDTQAYPQAIGVLFGHPLSLHNWSYPLFTLPVFWPLARLPYFVALAVWTLALWGAFTAVTLSQIERLKRLYALFALSLAPACLINVASGQNGFLSATLILGGLIWLDRRPVAAGIMFGLLAFKPQLALVLPFILLALEAWRAIVAATLTVIVLFAGSVAYFGIEPWQRYFEVTGAYQFLLLHIFQGFHTTMMVSVFAGARTFGLSFSTAMAIQIAVALPVLVFACLAVRRTSDPCRRAFVLAGAVPLITPYAYNYDLTALAAPLIWTLGGRLSLRAEWRWVYFVAYCAPVVTMRLQPLGLGVMPLVSLAVFCLSVREAWGRPVRYGDRADDADRMAEAAPASR